MLKQTNLKQTRERAHALELVSSNEPFLKESTAHAFADLLLFTESNGIDLKKIPSWTSLSTWATPRVFSEDIQVSFEQLLGICTKDTAEGITLDTKKLYFRFKKVLPIPFSSIPLEICFDLVAEIPESYKEVLRAIGNIRREVSPETTTEVIGCSLSESSDHPFQGERNVQV